MSDVPVITVESATGYSDEDGFYVLVLGEDGDVRLRFPTEVAAAHMLAACRPMEDWVDDCNREFKAWRRAPLNERLQVLHGVFLADALDPEFGPRVDAA